MTYCLAVKVNEGIVMLSDTRTNAGLDDVSRFRKMFVYEQRGERALALLTAGNLGVTQGVITRIEAAVDAASRGEDVESVLTCASLYRAVELIGEAMQAMQVRDRARIEATGAAADASIIVAGQRKGGKLRLFLVYSAGNFIEATDDTPFLQIGEHKYGKPILDRVIEAKTPLQDAIKAALISMDSTMRSNLGVGMPLDLALIREGQHGRVATRRLEADDAGFRTISEAWSKELREAFHALPDVPID